MKDDSKLGIGVLSGVALMIIVGVSVFLFGENDQGNTGWEIISHQGGWYLSTMGLFAGAGLAMLYYGYKAYQKSQEAKSMIGPIIICFVFWCLTFGKGCTDKANDGVTGPKGRPTTQVSQ